MLTDTEKAALERAAVLFEWQAEEWPDRYAASDLEDAATLRGLIERAGWQPIETAPKDGSCFLAWWPGVYSGCQVVYWGINYNTGHPEYGIPAWLYGCGYCFNKPPAYWQPLPAPPTE